MVVSQQLTDRFNRFLERHLPSGLYQRALIILIAPVVLLQTIMAGIILDRHWDNVTKALGRSLSMEIGMLVDSYQKSDKSPAAVADIEQTASQRLRLDMDVVRGVDLPPPIEPPFYALFERKMQKYLTRDTGRPFWVNSSAPNNQVEVQVEVEKGTIFRILTESDRAQASGTGTLLALMLASSGVLLGIAILAFTIALTQRLRMKNKPIGEFVTLCVVSALFMLHISQQTLWAKAIIAHDNTYLMNGPSAGASVLAIVRDGHRVEVLGKKDVWTKVKLGESEGYIRTSNLLPVNL